MREQRVAFVELAVPSPFALPLMVERFREKLTTEKLKDRLERMLKEMRTPKLTPSMSRAVDADLPERGGGPSCFTLSCATSMIMPRREIRAAARSMPISTYSASFEWAPIAAQAEALDDRGAWSAAQRTRRRCRRRWRRRDTFIGKPISS